jgi:hypothetical protein
VSPRPDGEHFFTVTATNDVGTTGVATQWVIDIDTQASAARAELIAIGKDSGTRGDFITNDGSAGRLLQGRITTGLADNEKVQVSFDNGANWSDVSMTSATTWSAIDPLAHSAGWNVQMRVIDVAGNATTSSQAITLDTQAPGAPQAILRHNDLIIVDITGTGAQVGDVVKVVIGNEHADHSITQADLDAGQVSVPIEAGHDIAEPYQAAIIDHANNASEFTLRTPNVSVNDLDDLTPIRGVGPGTTLDLGGFDVAFVSSNAANGIIGAGEVITGGATPTSNVLHLYSSATQPTVITLHDDRQASYIKFSYNDLESPLTLRFYDLDGNVVHTARPPQTGDRITLTFELELPPGVLFHSMQMLWSAGEGIALDDFLFGFRNEDITSSLVPTDQTLSDGTGLLVGSAVDDIFRLTNVDDLDTVTRIAGNGGKDMLVLEGGGQVLDFTRLAEKFESLEIIDMTGTGDNTLNLSAGDVLAQGQIDMFYNSGNAQMMIKGNAGDVVSISDLLPDGSDVGNWQMAGNVTLEGVQYSVYQHTNVTAEVLVQQGVMTHLENS